MIGKVTAGARHVPEILIGSPVLCNLSIDKKAQHVRHNRKDTYT